MPCYHPLEGWYSRTRNASGKRSVVFTLSEGYRDRPVTVPCGQCVGCRLERSRQWAVRMMHESTLHQDNIFLTLTYSDGNLPDPPSLQLRDFQLFFKRLRKYFSDRTIRFFHCGEYGDLNGRPHYHAVIFGLDFEDKVLYSKSPRGDCLYMSRTLDLLWGNGMSTFGAVTYESCAYVARYVLKKRTGLIAADHYERTDTETGEIFDLKPEYCTMSRRPGIGQGWYAKFSGDVFPSDEIIFGGRPTAVPRYYNTQLERTDPTLLASLKLRRIKRAVKHKADSTPRRLRDREVVKQASISVLTRKV